MTVFDDRVVPHHLYAREVIAGGLRRRHEGATWERAAEACTASGQLDPSTLKRWHRSFQLESGNLMVILPPGMHFRFELGKAILGLPAGSWSSKPSQEDPWARSPPQL